MAHLTANRNFQGTFLHFALACAMAVVAANWSDGRRQNRVLPTWNIWPSCSCTGTVTLIAWENSPINVPLLLPQSSSHHAFLCQYSRACRRDIDRSYGRTIEHGDTRPNPIPCINSSGSNRLTKPSSGPLMYINRGMNMFRSRLQRVGILYVR